ncbi:IclR family transcriptional regulator [Nocardia cyriacigeorgica]|uniref:IclR family transcriptional regulator n=1 Tax=Nocardia cyriacigeorgica TaxID=135487 RepID=UPI0002EC258C|nr:IclR family transcriptional regulator [Nocardia cyriacigeorgica]MBF6324197.1 IclR family transcriptional regulator [Nocardia cyriacigeorgica]MBF6498080.1 IclR family transcriptional regulator [Nocardia cyriacigeorgica]TLF60251.1 IclR family transcriptional regulator [Nocardia cyriacigeorgica]
MTVEVPTHPGTGALRAGQDPVPRPEPPVSMIERMTLILDAFDGATPALTLHQLVERTGLPRSTVHRILDQMIRLRWLAHAPGGYRLGLRVLELGGLAAGHNEIRDAVSPLLHDLCRRSDLELVGHLGVLDGREVLYLDKVGGRYTASVPTRLGGRMPAHSTALGKAMLAAMEPSVVDASFRDRLPQLTARTIGDRVELHRELDRIRHRQGVAVDNEESVPGIGCVAVPVRRRGMAVAALSLSTRVGADRSATDISSQARMLMGLAREATDLLAARF